MRFWRICRRRYAADAATGEGARLYDGRWNSRCVRVVYTSTSPALSAMETFVNLEPNLRPADLVFIEGEIPDTVEIGRLDPKRLPAVGMRGEMSPCVISAMTGFTVDKARLCSFHPRDTWGMKCASESDSP
jgi:RES domain-containing protein